MLRVLMSSHFLIADEAMSVSSDRIALHDHKTVYDVISQRTFPLPPGKSRTWHLLATLDGGHRFARQVNRTSLT